MVKRHDHRGKVEGVHKDGLVGEIRRYNKQKSCDLGENIFNAE